MFTKRLEDHLTHAPHGEAEPIRAMHGEAEPAYFGGSMALRPSVVASPPSQELVMPPVSSNASMTISDANRSFCKACSFARFQGSPYLLRLQPRTFHSYKVFKVTLVDPIQPNADIFRYFYGIG